MRKLPKKWCIKQNVHQDVCDWFNEKFKSNRYVLYGGYTYLHNVSKTNSCDVLQNEILDGYSEITYEEFKYHILNEPQIKSGPEDLTFLKELLIQNGIN
jgi:hypothetical protein